MLNDCIFWRRLGYLASWRAGWRDQWVAENVHEAPLDVSREAISYSGGVVGDLVAV